MALNNDDIKQLIAILQKGLDNTEQETMAEIKPKKRKAQHKISKNQNNTKKAINKFTDMPEANMHKEDTEIDRLLSRQSPVARIREFTPINVVCRVCGKRESINPALVTEGAARYKCNRCSTSEG